MGRGPNWTDKEIATLREWYGREPIARVAERVGRPYYSVTGKARQLGLDGYAWTPDEDDTLRALYPTQGARAVQRALKRRTLRAIGSRASALGVACECAERAPRDDCWSDAEVATLLEHYPERTAREVGEMIGRSAQAVRIKAYRLRQDDQQ